MEALAAGLVLDLRERVQECGGRHTGAHPAEWKKGHSDAWMASCLQAGIPLALKVQWLETANLSDCTVVC